MDKIYLLITIDTENPQLSLVKGIYKEDTMLNSRNRKNYGIKKIIDIFNEFNIKGTFYLNIYEKYYMGEQLLNDVCNLLLSYKQDIQLHTHPVWQYDPFNKKKVFMKNYSLNEQVDIINSGIKDIQKITGLKPIAHRGGGYGINNNTLKALVLNGIKIDSSMYYKYLNCKVNYWSYNTIIKKDNLIEFPVSVFKEINIKNSLLQLSKKESIKKLDINLCSLDEIKWFYNHIKIKGIHYINLFMHSFSLYEFYSKDINSKNLSFQPDKAVIKRLYNILKFFSEQKNVEIVTVSKFYNIITKNNYLLKEKDCLPIRIIY